uniref:C-type lectin domain-containing protein n=1 Tax=Anolis carolinensis TaxID=28377 RepID=A0A803TVX9_ANOCA
MQLPKPLHIGLDFQTRDHFGRHSLAVFQLVISLLELWFPELTVGSLMKVPFTLTKNHNKLGHDCVCPSCPDDWIGYRRKCYYFSLEKRNWTSSQDFCSSQKATLLIFNDNKEKVRGTNSDKAGVKGK